MKIATPISDLFDNPSDRQMLLALSDCLECRDKSINTDYGGQELFHSDLQPTHEFCKEDFSLIKKIAGLKRGLKLITFHAASSCDRPYLERGMFQPAGRQYSRAELLKNAQENFLQIKSIFGQQVKIAIENNNYYPSKAYQCVTDADFLCQLVYDNNIFFLFDISHAKITAHNRKLTYEEYKNSIPLDRTVQIHINRFAIDDNNLAIDAHNLPDNEDWQEVKNIISSGRFVEYLTVEYYGNANELAKALKKARGVINGLS